MSIFGKDKKEKKDKRFELLAIQGKCGQLERSAYPAG